MIKTILSDFSLVVLFPKDKNYKGKLNELHAKLTKEHGEYNFFDYFELNEELLSYYTQLKDRYSVNVFTTGVVQNASAVRKIIDKIFDNIYTAKDYGISKTDPESYKFIAKKMNRDTNEIIFIDDRPENINAASKSGMVSVQYKEIPKLKKDLEEFLT